MANHDVQIIIGMIEPVKLKLDKKSIEFLARIDTGATRSSIDRNIAEQLKLQKHEKEIVVKNSHGKSKRNMVNAKIILANKTFENKFTLADRSHMKFPILIGRDILEQGFLIDTTKTIELEVMKTKLENINKKLKVQK
ncbi:MAG: RimK/LysX family protein [Candidatus Woesearchaeota archaeon]